MFLGNVFYYCGQNLVTILRPVSGDRESTPKGGFPGRFPRTHHQGASGGVMEHQNKPNYFPELRFDTLEAYAYKWGEARDDEDGNLYWPFVKRIILFRTPVAYDYKKKYLLFFELSEITDKNEKNFPQLIESTDWLTWLGDNENHFQEIYKKKPGKGFLNEWIVMTNLPKGVPEKHSWILFSRTSDRSIIKKTLPVQEDRIDCQEIAENIWKEYSLDIKYMKMHPDIKKITGKQYKDKTIHNWFSEVAPPDVKRPGRRSKNYEKKQIAICKKLKIEVPKK
jgi:hypothetical protein